MKKRVITIVSILIVVAMCLPMVVLSEPKSTQDLIIVDNVGTITGTQDNPIYSFIDGSGTLTIPQGYKAVVRILVVGGGGSGSSYKSANPYCGLGGDAIEKKAYLTEGSYQITVGNGGESVIFTNDSPKVAGKAGEASSFKGNDIDILALGGAGGTGKIYTNKGLESDITGTFKTYGKDPGTTTITIEANSGNGASKVLKGNESLPGQAGVVIVKIESFVKPGEHTFTYSKEGTTLYARCTEGCANGYDENPLEL